MTRIETDRRHIDAEPDPEGERAAATIAAEYLDTRLRLARALLRIERGRTFALSGCASVVQYGVRLGVPASEARALVDLGRALEAQVSVHVPVSTGDGTGDRGEVIAQATVEDRIRAGRLAVENAAVAGRLLAEPGLVLPGEDWIGRAEALRTSELRREVQRRVESAAQGTSKLLPITVHVTERVRDDFHRARSLVSREAQLMLTEGQVFARIVRFYLDSEDPLRGRRGGDGVDAAGGPPSGARQRNRYVSASARGAVLARSSDRCEVPGCPHDTFLEFAHIEPHALGGSADARNLLRLCHAHHTQFDAGCLTFAAWCDDDGRGGRPRFRDASGEDIAAGTRHTSRASAEAERGFRDSAHRPGDRTSPSTPPELGESGAHAESADSDRDASFERRAPSSRGAWPGESDGGAWGVGEAPAPSWRVHRRRSASEPDRGISGSDSYRQPRRAQVALISPGGSRPRRVTSGVASRPPP